MHRTWPHFFSESPRQPPIDVSSARYDWSPHSSMTSSSDRIRFATIRFSSSGGSHGRDAYFNAHALSDGTLRFICLSTLLLQPSLPNAILIDEPELGQRPYAIHQLASLIRRASQDCKVILSTQSVTLLNQFEPHDVVVVERDGAESTFRRHPLRKSTTWKTPLRAISETNVLFPT